jgi:hypothetical protein
LCVAGGLGSIMDYFIQDGIINRETQIEVLH